MFQPFHQDNYMKYYDFIYDDWQNMFALISFDEKYLKKAKSDIYDGIIKAKKYNVEYIFPDEAIDEFEEIDWQVNKLSYQEATKKGIITIFTAYSSEATI